ncbi:MAG: EamA family transporter, partial [Trueperaceae bacterium]|nr:EamA family transporter [Trueperaceae bacterium]
RGRWAVTRGQRVAGFTVLALLAFAGNSLLARAAIGPAADGGVAIDPVGFTALRLAAGAVVLALLVGPRALALPAPGPERRRTLWAVVALVAYALPFSVAYVELGAAAGALLLFGAVQVTMGAVGLAAGERPGARGLLGWGSALAGLVVLLLPGAQAPDPLAATIMAVAGVAWGAYTLLGRAGAAPLTATARAFVWALPAALGLAAWPGAWTGATPAGIGLAVASGALASGLGYAVWYVALPALTRTVAAVVQLAVPLVAAVAAVVWLGEGIGWRFAVASLLVLGGIAAVVVPGRRAAPTAAASPPSA